MRNRLYYEACFTEWELKTVMSEDQRADLHMHTYYSDGRASPEAVVRHAVEIGLAAIAITDHDNMRGYREALPFAQAAGIDLIPGIETTVYWPELRRELDVLGYWVDSEHPDLLALERGALANLHERAGELCALLAADGYPVSVDDGLAINPRRVGPLEVVASLLKKGLIADLPEGWVLFRRYWGQVSVPKLTITRSIDAIRAAGGIPVLAHPCRIRPEPLTADELAPVVAAGLGAIEINHPDMNDSMKAHYRALAKRFDLLTSGGTDEHGWPEGFPRMGTQPVTVATAEGLRARAGV